MVTTSAIVPLVVAVIGVIGAIVPIYINNATMKDSPDVNVGVREIDPNATQFMIRVINSGDAPATNLSVMLNAVPMKILTVTNNFSTAELTLSDLNNTILEPGINKTVNQSLVSIQTPKLVQGAASTFELVTHINGTSPRFTQEGVRVVYDQGSELGGALGPLSLPQQISPFISPLIESTRTLWSFYVIFYAVLFGFLYRYVRRRKRLKTLLTRVVTNVMEIRRVLRDDQTDKRLFPEVWFGISEKIRHDNYQTGDYLLIDDFYSELKNRNSHLMNSSTIDKNSTIELNRRCLRAAERMLKDIDWNKYR